MPFVTLQSDGLSIACFLAEHDWETAYAVSHYYAGDVTSGLSKRESRRPEAEALLLDVQLRIFAEGVEAQALRQAFAALGTGWVGIPLLADCFDGAAAATPGARIYQPQRLIDLTVPAIAAGDAPLTAGHTYAPLLVGHITKLPAIQPQSGGLALCSVIVTEDSPWTFRIGIVGAVAPGVWPESLAPDWTSPPVETPTKELAFSRIGHQREQTIAGEESAFCWTEEAGFSLLDKTEIATLLGFFVACRGVWRPFESPLWFTPGIPTAAAPHATALRFAEPALKLAFTTSHVAQARVKLVQVPWEIVGTAGEQPLQPPRLYLYRFTHLIPEPEVWRFTTCWRPLARTNDGTYVPAPVAHDRIDEGIDGRTSNVTLESFLFDDSPLARFNPLTLEGPLQLEIFAIESDPIEADLAELIWAGTVPAAPQEGRSFRAECAFQGGLFDRELPSVLILRTCQTRPFTPWCGLVKAAFAKAGTLTTSAGHYVTVTTDAPGAANLYAHGAIEVGSGATWERRAVLASSPVPGGHQFVLDWPLRQAAVGQAVTFYRGCDRTAAACQALGNFERFRGFPNLPRVNLSLPGIDFAGKPRAKK